jgi:hypothetical protein
MNTLNVVNNVPYLRTSREFPLAAQGLAQEVSKSYLDIASAVNSRTIGIFPVNKPAVTGEQWFVSTDQRRQTIRQVWNVTGAGTIAHNIETANIVGFTRIYGTFTDGSIWYPLPYVDVSAADNQINVTIDSTYININAGAGSPPSITSGYIVLEWIA